MEKVLLYRLNSEAKQEKIAEFCLNESGVVEVAGEEIVNPVARGILQRGIGNYSSEGPEQLMPEDGRKFLEQMRHNFKSGYLIATDVEGE